MHEKSIWSSMIYVCQASRRTEKVPSDSQLGTVHTCLSSDKLEVPMIDAFDRILKSKKGNALVIWA